MSNNIVLDTNCLLRIYRKTSSNNMKQSMKTFLAAVTLVMAAVFPYHAHTVGTYSCICPQPVGWHPCGCGQIQEYVPTADGNGKPSKYNQTLQYATGASVKILS